MKKTLLILLLSAFSFIGADAQTSCWKHFRWNPDHPSDLCGKDTVRLSFIGDVMMHTLQIEHSLSKGHGTFLKGIEKRLKNADLAVANMEFTLAGKPYTGYPAFSAPDSFASYVAGCGVDVFLTANNHILDKGAAGALRTVSVYDSLTIKRGIMHTGTARDAEMEEANNPLIIRVKGIKLALLNFTYGTNSPVQSTYPKVYRMSRRNEIEATVRKAEEMGADFIIALPHWGTEYHLRCNNEQRETALWLAACGVDAIIGTHPHVVQNREIVETRDGRQVPVYYSIGNAVSNMSARNTQVGLMVSIMLEKDCKGNVRLLGTDIEYLWCSRPGEFIDSFCTLVIEEHKDRREDWISGYAWDRMMSSYANVKEETEK